jgi:7-cyano-7-deazaguanine synthase
METKKAVILLSGGIDSATVAAIAIKDGFDLHALIFSYGQRHHIEIESAKRLSRFFGIKGYRIIEIPTDIFKSALTNKAHAIQKNGKSSDREIPNTYVPARNIIFLSYALAYAESIGAESIFIGATAVDFSGYPDCRPEFFKAFQLIADVGTKSGISGERIRIETPLINLSKALIIQKGISLGVDYSLTHSCYDPGPDGLACGLCDSCRIRKRGFIEAGVPDPTIYQNR